MRHSQNGSCPGARSGVGVVRPADLDTTWPRVGEPSDHRPLGYAMRNEGSHQVARALLVDGDEEAARGLGIEEDGAHGRVHAGVVGRLQAQGQIGIRTGSLSLFQMAQDLRQVLRS